MKIGKRNLKKKKKRKLCVKARRKERTSLQARSGNFIKLKAIKSQERKTAQDAGQESSCQNPATDYIAADAI